MAEKVQRLRVSMIRDQNKKELLEKVATLRQELATLRVAKVTGQSTSKVGKINTVRKCFTNQVLYRFGGMKLSARSAAPRAQLVDRSA